MSTLQAHASTLKNHVLTLLFVITHCLHVSTLQLNVSTLILLDLNLCSLSSCADFLTRCVDTLYSDSSLMSSCIDSSSRCVKTFNQSFRHFLHVSTPQEHVSVPFSQNIFFYFSWLFEHRSIQVFQEVLFLNISDIQELQSDEILQGLLQLNFGLNSSMMTSKTFFEWFRGFFIGFSSFLIWTPSISSRGCMRNVLHWSPIILINLQQTWYACSTQYLQGVKVQVII